MTVFAVVATGEMGYALARALVESGHRVLTSLDGRGARTAERAAAAGAEDAGSLSATGAGAFLSVLPPARALGLAEQVARALAGRTGGLLYADCNAVSPATSARVGEIVGAAGARFVDVGIIGLPPRPVLYASGEPAGDL